MITLRHTIFGRNTLDEWPFQRRDLYLTTQTSTSPAEFEPTLQVGERPQTHAIDHAATGIISDGIFFNLAQQPPVGQGLLTHEVSRSRSTTYHSQ